MWLVTFRPAKPAQYTGTERQWDLPGWGPGGDRSFLRPRHRAGPVSQRAPGLERGNDTLYL